jgi:hypothetical protein
MAVGGDVEMVERDLEQRVVGHRGLSERVDDRLEVLQRLRVAAVLDERHPALVLPASEIFAALCGEGPLHGGERRQETARERAADRMEAPLRHCTFNVAVSLGEMVMNWPGGLPPPWQIRSTR